MHRIIIFLYVFATYTVFGMHSSAKIIYNLCEPESSSLFYDKLRELGFGVSSFDLYPTSLPEGWSLAHASFIGTPLKGNLTTGYMYQGKLRFQIYECQHYYEDEYKALIYEDL